MRITMLKLKSLNYVIFRRFQPKFKYSTSTSRLLQLLSTDPKPSAPAINKKYNNAVPQKRIWGYVAVAFNRVDNDRLIRVGPDRLCAEWLLKNGGAVGFLGMGGKLLRDYNSLPSENTKTRIQIVDASNSSIMKIGFDHFIGCEHIDTVILHNCKHLEEDGLEGLKYLKDTLKTLQVSGCYNMREHSFYVLRNLQNLQNLKLSNFIYVKDLKGVANKLQQSLPKCKIVVE